MLPLSLAEPRVPQSIAKITGKDEVRRHLSELGLVVGEEVTVISSLAGNLILQGKDRSRIVAMSFCEPRR